MFDTWEPVGLGRKRRSLYGDTEQTGMDLCFCICCVLDFCERVDSSTSGVVPPYGSGLRLTQSVPGQDQRFGFTLVGPRKADMPPLIAMATPATTERVPASAFSPQLPQRTTLIESLGATACKVERYFFCENCGHVSHSVQNCPPSAWYRYGMDQMLKPCTGLRQGPTICGAIAPCTHAHDRKDAIDPISLGTGV